MYGSGRVVLAHVVAAPGRFVDVVAEERHQVGRIGGDVAIRAEVALLVLLAGGEGEAQASGRRASAAGAVRVRPTALCAPAVMKRYQYQRSGKRPLTSTWTEWAHAGSALVCPEEIIDFMASSVAISQRTGTARGSSAPIDRVHSTMPSGDG